MSHIKAKMTTSLITAMNKLEAVELVRCTKCPGSPECAGRYVLNFLILNFSDGIGSATVSDSLEELAVPLVPEHAFLFLLACMKW